MQLEPVIAALKARCAAFNNRISGAAQFKLLPETMQLTVPCAYVIPLDDAPQESRSLNSIRQPMVDSFAVIVALSNTPDEKGQAATHSVDSLRTALWAALLGWRPADRYDGINYEGGTLLQVDRARLWYQFEFGALMEIEPGDGWQDIDLATLPHLDVVNVQIDAISPQFDPNLASIGPDGRIEQTVPVPKSGTLP